eukprot:g47736.t1
MFLPALDLEGQIERPKLVLIDQIAEIMAKLLGRPEMAGEREGKKGKKGGKGKRKGKKRKPRKEREEYRKQLLDLLQHSPIAHTTDPAVSSAEAGDGHPPLKLSRQYSDLLQHGVVPPLPAAAPSPPRPGSARAGLSRLATNNSQVLASLRSGSLMDFSSQDAKQAGGADQGEGTSLEAENCREGKAEAAGEDEQRGPLTEDEQERRLACQALLLEELHVLLAIYGADITLSSAIPSVMLKVNLRQEEVECLVEVGFVCTPDYPLAAPVQLALYIAPPFTHPHQAVLTARLRAMAASLSQEQPGEGGALCLLLEEVKTYIDEHISALEDSKQYRVTVEPESFQEAQKDHQQNRRPELAKQPTGESCSTPTEISGKKEERRKPRVQQKVEAQTLEAGAARSGSIKAIESVRTKFRQCLPTQHLPVAAAKLHLFQNGWDVEMACKKAMEEARANRDISLLPPEELTKQESLGTSTMRRARSGLEARRTGPSVFNCAICLEMHSLSSGLALRECKHFFCFDCWESYITDKVRDGAAIIRCAGHHCPQYVDEEVVMLVTRKDPSVYSQYRKWMEHSYVKMKGWRWCPTPGCPYIARDSPQPAASQAKTKPKRKKNQKKRAAEDAEGDRKLVKDPVVACHCGALYCLHCGEDAHWPVSCQSRSDYLSSPVVQAARSNIQTTFRAVSNERLQVPTKPCPRCGTPWWKNGGCDHFTCSCGHQFCWSCLGAWFDHSDCPQSQEDNTDFTDFGEEIITVMVSHSAVSLKALAEQEAAHDVVQQRVRELIMDKDKFKALCDALPLMQREDIFWTLRLLDEGHARLRYTYVLIYIYFLKLPPIPRLKTIHRKKRGKKEADGKRYHQTITINSLLRNEDASNRVAYDMENGIAELRTPAFTELLKTAAETIEVFERRLDTLDRQFVPVKHQLRLKRPTLREIKADIEATQVCLSRFFGLTSRIAQELAKLPGGPAEVVDFSAGIKSKMEEMKRSYVRMGLTIKPG